MMAGAVPNGHAVGESPHRRTAGASLRKWLADADWSVGTLQQYLDFLQENFDSPAQLSEIYSKLGADGSRAFDFAQFFEDVGVQDPLHRRLFQSWFSCPDPDGAPERAAGRARADSLGEDRRPPPPSSGAAGAGGGAVGRGSGLAAETSPGPKVAAAAASGAEVGGRAGATRSGAKLEDWLGSPELSSGVLARYRRQFEDNFDDPALYPNQLSDAYVLKCGDRWVFDEASFFGDLGIEDPGHRELFRAWFREQFGAVGRAAS